MEVDRDFKYVFFFTVILFLMIVLDYIWLNYIAQGLFYSQLDHITGFRDYEFEIRTLYTSLLYFLVGLAILFFFDPGIEEDEKSIMLGSFIGMFIFIVIEFTNYVFYSGYSPVVVVIDIIWGTFLFGLTSHYIYYYKDKFLTLKE